MYTARMIKQVNSGLRSGTIAIPASKSDAQRAYLAAAMAPGKSTITGWGNSNDEQSMLKAIKLLGATIEIEGEELMIEGIDRFSELPVIRRTVKCRSKLRDRCTVLPPK